MNVIILFRLKFKKFGNLNYLIDDDYKKLVA
jgi:hypothetical protein